MIAKNDNDLFQVQIHYSPQGSAAVQIVPLRGQLEEHSVVTQEQLEQIERVRRDALQALFEKVVRITIDIVNSQENNVALNQVVMQGKTSHEILNSEEQSFFDAYSPLCLNCIQASFEGSVFQWILPREERQAIVRARGIPQLQLLVSKEDCEAIVRAQCIPMAKLVVAKITKISRHFLQQDKQEMDDARQTQALFENLCMGLPSFTRADLRTLRAVLQIHDLIQVPIPIDAAYFSSEDNRTLSRAFREALENVFRESFALGQSCLEQLEDIIDARLTKRFERPERKSSETDEKQPELKRQKK